MNNSLTHVLILVLIVLCIYYFAKENNIVQSTGEMIMKNKSKDQKTNTQKGSSRKITEHLTDYRSPDLTLSSLHSDSSPSIRSKASTDSIVSNPQIDDQLNLSKSRMDIKSADYESNPGEGSVVVSDIDDPKAINQYNVAKYNSNVLPHPQISYNFTQEGELCKPEKKTQENFESRFTKPFFQCFPKDTVTPQELMPREDPYNTWSQVNPTPQGHLADKNFLESGHHFGINTIGSSLRNGNQQVRSDPLIPQYCVSPWLNSTIDPDSNRRHFDIGGDY